MTSSANQVEPLWKSGRENQKIRQKNIDILHADGMRAFQNKNKQTNNSNKLRRSGGTGVRRGGGAARGGKPQKGSKKPSIDPTNLKRVQVAQRNKKEEIRKKRKAIQKMRKTDETEGNKNETKSWWKEREKERERERERERRGKRKSRWSLQIKTRSECPPKRKKMREKNDMEMSSFPRIANKGSSRIRWRVQNESLTAVRPE